MAIICETQARDLGLQRRRSRGSDGDVACDPKRRKKEKKPSIPWQNPNQPESTPPCREAKVAGRSKPVEFSIYSFPSQKQFEERCRQIRNRWDGRGDLAGPDFKFMLAILRNSKYATDIASGVKRIYVAKARVYRTNSFWFETLAGKKTSFSPVKALRQEAVPKRFKEACRHAILPERQEVKAKFLAEHPEAMCPITGEQLALDTLDAHHTAPSFKELLGRFTREFIPNRALETLIDDYTNFADKEMERHWQEFHRRHAKLEVVSKAEHKDRHKAREQPAAEMDYLDIDSERLSQKNRTLAGQEAT